MNSQVEEIVQFLKYGKKINKSYKYDKMDTSKEDHLKLKRVTPVADSLKRAKGKVKKSIKRKKLVDYLSK